MELAIRKAGPEDIEFCLEKRIEVLLAANGLGPGTDMSQVRRHTREYYARNLGGGAHIELLAFAGEDFVGCGSASIYSVMPTYSNPAGKKAYIMNMYTCPAYRRKGVAAQILEKLIGEIRALGIEDIQLEATAMGRPLYEKMGFAVADAEMVLKG